jgi:hypothetical protein
MLAIIRNQPLWLAKLAGYWSNEPKRRYEARPPPNSARELDNRRLTNKA